MTRLISLWLMADGLWTAIWFAGFLDSLAGRDMVSVMAMIARTIVGALSVVAGWSISQPRSTPALGIAAAALVAAFSVIDAASGVLPSNLDPSFRWPVAWLQVAAAAVATVALRPKARERM